MSSIRLLDLGLVSPVRSQTVYHAVARALQAGDPPTIILVSPHQPYVCIGYHQDVDAEVDLAYCEARALPVYRREVGGGAVYLDAGQVFVQWVFPPGMLPTDLGERFALYVKPLVETYRALGIPAVYRPVNDVHADGKKIGGTGAAQIGAADVVVGSLMFTFDKGTMARVLKVASEKMRDKVFQGLEQYMTTMTEQLGRTPDRDEVVALYTQHAAAALGAEITPGALTAAELAEAATLDDWFQTPEWLYHRSHRQTRGVKIHEDVRVAEGTYKAAGGLIRATVRVHAQRVDAVAFSGDFTLFPAAALSVLENALIGSPLREQALVERLATAFEMHSVQAPGVAPVDFMRAIWMAVAQIA